MSYLRLARVEWRSRITGYAGHGHWLPRSVVDDAVEKMNKECPHLFHWAVDAAPPVPAPTVEESR